MLNLKKQQKQKQKQKMKSKKWKKWMQEPDTGNNKKNQQAKHDQLQQPTPNQLKVFKNFSN